MKKILSITFVMMAMTLAVVTANAQGWKNDSDRKIENKDLPNRKVGDKDDDYRDDRDDRDRFPNKGKGIVKTYTETKITQVGKKLYREIYEIKVFKNGKTTSKLISRVEVKKRQGRKGNQFPQQSINTYFHTATIWENGREYRVTYKITEYRNGNVDSEIIKRVRI